MAKIYTLMGKVSSSMTLKQSGYVVKLDQRISVLNNEYQNADIQDALKKGFLELVSTQVIGEVSQSQMDKILKGKTPELKNKVNVSNVVNRPQIKSNNFKGLLPNNKLENLKPVKHSEKIEPPKSDKLEISDESMEKLVSLLDKRLKGVSYIPLEMEVKKSGVSFNPSSVVPVLDELESTSSIKTKVEEREGDSSKDTLKKLKLMRKKGKD